MYTYIYIYIQIHIFNSKNQEENISTTKKQKMQLFHWVMKKLHLIEAKWPTDERSSKLPIDRKPIRVNVVNKKMATVARL